MQTLFILIICVFTISMIVIVAIRIYLKYKSGKFEKKLYKIPSYNEKHAVDQSTVKSPELCIGGFIDIQS